MLHSHETVHSIDNDDEDEQQIIVLRAQCIAIVLLDKGDHHLTVARSGLNSGFFVSTHK